MQQDRKIQLIILIAFIVSFVYQNIPSHVVGELDGMIHPFLLNNIAISPDTYVWFIGLNIGEIALLYCICLQSSDEKFLQGTYLQLTAKELLLLEISVKVLHFVEFFINYNQPLCNIKVFLEIPVNSDLLFGLLLLIYNIPTFYWLIKLKK